MTLFISRLRLSRSPSIAAMQAVLEPDDPATRKDTNHRLLWSVFAGDPDRKRDFLWRDEGRGQFTALSRRKPVHSPFFEPPDVKDFTPILAPGDVLSFALRTNATRTVKSNDTAPNGRPKRKHRDVVMDALHPIAAESRAEHRMSLANKAGTAWLERQGEVHGFAVQRCAAEDYSVVTLPGYKGRRKGQPQFGILDLSGKLEVRDPDAFLSKISSGFGRARAFGCGLMLIRRA